MPVITLPICLEHNYLYFKQRKLNTISQQFLKEVFFLFNRIKTVKQRDNEFFDIKYYITYIFKYSNFLIEKFIVKIPWKFKSVKA